MKSRRASGYGERAAVSGYSAQWNQSAPLILDALRSDEFEWIAVADPEAGQLDDLQIGSKTKVDAYQIRWEAQPSPLSFKDLTSPRGGKPALIAQLAGSWKTLRDHHKRRVVVHFRTNRLVSTNDSGAGGKTFASFLAEVVERGRGGQAIPKAWAAAWSEFRDASGLSETEFDQFIRDCVFELGVRLPTREVGRDAEQARRDEQDIVNLLIALVSDPAGIVTVDKEELIQRLSWSQRVNQRSAHEFPVEAAIYEPIEQSVRALEEKLDALSQGYLAVLGSPGSGKSTLLTETLCRRAERFVPYYAYIPESQDPISVRGESENFLHDVVIALERRGFSQGRSLANFDRMQLQERFLAQLAQLAAEYKTSGRKTIFLIDGLDHIDREQHPSRSLLRDLPEPSQVPEGVIFVLGSQTDLPFPSAVQASVRQSGRRIEMQFLERGAVMRVIAHSAVADRLDDKLRELVWLKSAGHPLALRILLRRLEGISGVEELKAALDEAEPIQHSIEEQYQSYWESLSSDDPEVARLLALMSRLRTLVDLDWIARWTDANVLVRFRRRAYQYFWAETVGQWHFFHNSFRVFIEQRSAEGRPGVHDPSTDRALHRELGLQCEKATEPSLQRWERIYHLARAEELQELVRVATADVFRDQLVSFRPVDAIQGDIEIALRAALQLRDVVAVVRFILLRAEFTQRDQGLGDHPLAAQLIELQDTNLATIHIRDGRRLRVSSKTALELTEALEESDRPEEARRVFDIAEPLSLLYSGIETLWGSETVQLLDAWAIAAVRYRPVGVIVAAIDGLRVVDEHPQQMDEQQLRVRLRFVAARAFADIGRWPDYQLMAQGIPADSELWVALRLAAYRAANDAGESDQANALLAEVAGRAPESLTLEHRVALAEILYRREADAADIDQMLSGLLQPELYTEVQSGDRGLGAYRHMIRLVRMQSIRGDRPAVSELVPEPSNSRNRGLVLFERLLCSVAQLDGRVTAGQRLSAEEIPSIALGYLRFFNRESRETRDYISWYSVQGARAEVFDWIIAVIARSGSPALNALKALFESEWSNPATGRYWSAELRRHVVLELVRHGLDRTWGLQTIQALESSLSGDDIDGRMTAQMDQAQSYGELGDRLGQRRCLVTAITTSLGVGYRKDHQFDHWIEWLGASLVREDPRGAVLLAWAAGAIRTLDESTEGRAQRTAAEELIRVAGRWSPVRAVNVFRWLSEQEAMSYDDTMAALLGTLAENPAADLDTVEIALVELLMPIATDAYPKIARTILERTAKERGKAAVAPTARRILEASRTSAAGDSRPGWQWGIATALARLEVDPTEAGLTASDTLADEEHRRSGDRLEVAEGQFLSVDQVRERVKDQGQLVALLERGGKDNEDFKWENVVDGVPIASLDELVRRLAARPRGVLVLARVAERLHEAGDYGKAWEVGLEALRVSTAEGWDRQWDGGSRLRALEALHHIDATRARTLAFERLESDAPAALRYSYQAALNLRDIAALLTSGESEVKGIMDEVEQHLRSLFAYTTIDTGELQDELAPSPEDTSPGLAITELVLLHMTPPVPLLIECSVRALAKLLVRGTASESAVRRELSGRDKNVVERLLAAIHGAVRSGYDPKPFAPEIRRLVQSDDWAIARAASEILRTAGQAVPERPSSKVPAIYSLVVELEDAIGGPLKLSMIRAGEPLPDTSNPRALIGEAYMLDLEIIARSARVNVDNLVVRTVALMNDEDPAQSWNAAGEKRLMQHLRATQLKFPFIRPRSLAIRRGLLRAAQELEDAGALSGSWIRAILSQYDPHLVTVRPIPRPGTMSALRRERFVSSDKWIADVAHVGDVMRRLPDGRIVIAQEGEVSAADRGHPTEDRRSLVCPGSLDTLDASEAEMPFQIEIGLRAADYPGISARSESLVVCNRANGWIGQPDWLALSPSIGRALGWALDAEGLFRWRDAAGVVAVESLWWRDGTPPAERIHDSETGEGWLVVATPQALKAISDLVGDLKDVTTVRRRAISEDGEHLEGKLTRSVESLVSLDAASDEAASKSCPA